MHRKLGRGAEQAYGINIDTLRKMLNTINPNTLRGVRDRAILLTAYDSLSRRSELVSLQTSDITISDVSTPPLIKLKLRRSKTDQESTGRWLFLSSEAQSNLYRWIKMSGIKDGALFRGVSNSGKVSSGLSSGQINRIYKRLATKAKLPLEQINKISGHSIRVGAAQDLLLTGASLPFIMNRGRWSKSDTVMQYVESAGLQSL